MKAIWLQEIEIPDCYSGKAEHFINWRKPIAAMTGVSLRYVTIEKPVSFGPPPAPQRLPFIEVELDQAASDTALTPRQQLGAWEALPPDPLLILLVLTLPGGTIRHQFAGAIAERLGEITELMYGIDDGRWGMIDLGRFTEAMRIGMQRIAARGKDSVVQGGFEVQGGGPPGGWWTMPGIE
jgi:hypothetical protein